MAPSYPRPNQPGRKLILIFDPRDFPKSPNRPPKPLYPGYGPQEMPRFPLDHPKKFLKPSPIPQSPKKWNIPHWLKPYRLGRAVPYLGWGLTAFELYQWWQAQPGVNAHYDMSGWTQICKNDWSPNPSCAGGPYGGAGMRVIGTAHTTPICGTPLQVFTAAMDGSYSIPSNVRTIYFGPIAAVNGCASRFTIEEQYAWPGSLPHTVPPWVPASAPVPAPGFAPDYMPPWLPSVDPNAIPIHQPMPTPRPLPYRDLPKNEPKPAPAPISLPMPGPAQQPSLDHNPGAAPTPGVHGRKPPEPGEKEKKTNPRRGPNMAAFMGAIDKSIGTITETDDFVAAVYKSLHWSVRRWKGRDGVWRDREFKTHQRLARIYKELGTMSGAALIKNLAANYAVDRLGGVIGELGRRAVDANQYYRGVQGLQSGQRFTAATWDDVLHEMRVAAARNDKSRDYYRWFYRHPDGNVFWSEPTHTTYQGRGGTIQSPYWDLPAGGEWVRSLVKGKKQVIPWLRYTYNRRVKPRRGTAEWWRRENTGIAFRPTAAYRRAG